MTLKEYTFQEKREEAALPVMKIALMQQYSHLKITEQD